MFFVKGYVDSKKITSQNVSFEAQTIFFFCFIEKQCSIIGTPKVFVFLTIAWFAKSVTSLWVLVHETRHISHVTKIRILKNLNLRKKADRNFRGSFLKNRFRHVKLYSNPPRWLDRSRCHMCTFWKTKDWSSLVWESQSFKFWYVEVHCERRLKSTKIGISS